MYINALMIKNLLRGCSRDEYRKLQSKYLEYSQVTLEEELRYRGFDVFEKNNTIFIDKNFNILSKEKILELSKKYSQNKDIGKIIILEETDSTNTELLKKATEFPHASIVVANSQTKGKARKETRIFVSPKDTGIYMSVLLKNVKDINLATLITPAAAVATRRGIERLVKDDVKIKWVNDLYINNKKLVGILAECNLSQDYKSVDSVVVGIGINYTKPNLQNLNLRNKKVLEALDKITSLCEDETPTFTRNAMIASVLIELLSVIDNIASREFLSDYKKNSCVLNKTVRFKLNNREHVAKALDIDDNARLVVYEAGEKIVLDSNEILILSYE